MRTIAHAPFLQRCCHLRQLHLIEICSQAKWFQLLTRGSYYYQRLAWMCRSGGRPSRYSVTILHTLTFLQLPDTSHWAPISCDFAPHTVLTCACFPLFCHSAESECFHCGLIDSKSTRAAGRPEFPARQSSDSNAPKWKLPGRLPTCLPRCGWFGSASAPWAWITSPWAEPHDPASLQSPASTTAGY